MADDDAVTSFYGLLDEIDGMRDQYADAADDDDWEGGFFAGLTAARRALRRRLTSLDPEQAADVPTS